MKARAAPPEKSRSANRPRAPRAGWPPPCSIARGVSRRQACRRFVYTENLLPTAAANAETGMPAKVAPLQSPSDAVPILMRVIEQMDTEDGWVSLGAVANQLANLASDFDQRTYGFRKLSDLVRQTNAFDVEHPEGGALRIRAQKRRSKRAP